MDDRIGSELEGQEVRNVRGERVGKIDALFSYGEVEKPNWARVKIGRLGLHKGMIPLENAEEADGTLRLPYESEHIQNAPEVEPEGDQLSEEEADLLCRHYGLERVAPPSGISDDDINLPREAREAKPPALDEGDDSPLVQRRRERARELGVPDNDGEGDQSAAPSAGQEDEGEPQTEGGRRETE